MNKIGWTALGTGLLLAGGAGLVAFGSSRWASATRAQVALLDAARLPAPAGQNKLYDARELDGLPVPVQRYFRAVLKDGQPLIATATFELAGTINMSETADNWKPFTSWQRAIVHRPGFLWNGSVTLFPGISARVHDSYIAGVGRLHAALLGLFTVAEVEGGGEIARGELMRYFAEMAWYPTALLPSQGVHWEAVDDRSANATLVDGPVSLTLLFGFDEAGLITSVHADERGSGVGKDMVMLPWDCSLSNYELRHGMLVPTPAKSPKAGSPISSVTSSRWSMSSRHESPANSMAGSRCAATELRRHEHQRAANFPGCFAVGFGERNADREAAV